MGHSQPSMPVVTGNTASNSIFNGAIKQKRSIALDMRFYWVRNRIRKKYFHILCDEGKKNLVDLFTKHHPIWHHRTMRSIFLKPTEKDIEKSKDRRTGTGRGCAVTGNSRVVRRPGNLPQGIQNIVLRNLDIILKGIQNLFQNRTRNQWPRWLAVPT